MPQSSELSKGQRLDDTHTPRRRRRPALAGLRATALTCVSGKSLVTRPPGMACVRVAWQLTPALGHASVITGKRCSPASGRVSRTAAVRRRPASRRVDAVWNTLSFIWFRPSRLPIAYILMPNRGRTGSKHPHHARPRSCKASVLSADPRQESALLWVCLKVRLEGRARAHIGGHQNG